MQHILMTLLILSLYATTAFAQMMIKTTGDDAFMIKELGVLLLEDDGAVTVRFSAPVEQRPEPYRQIDIKQGDVVLYLNGIRIRETKQFRAAFDSLNTGDRVEIGLKREDDRFIASFVKATPEDLPMNQTMKMTSGGNRTAMRIDMSTDPLMEKAKEVRPMLDLAVLIGNIDDRPVIINKLPIPGAFDKMDLQTKDIVTMVNGETIRSFQHFFDVWNRIDAGDDVSLTIKRGDSETTGTFAKPESRGQMKVRTEQR